MLATRCLLHSFYSWDYVNPPFMRHLYRNDRRIESGWRVNELRVGRFVNAQDVAAPNGRTKIHVSSTKGPLRTSCEFSYMFTCPFARSLNCVIRGSRTEKLGKKPLEIKHTFNAAVHTWHCTTPFGASKNYVSLSSITKCYAHVGIHSWWGSLEQQGLLKLEHVLCLAVCNKF